MMAVRFAETLTNWQPFALEARTIQCEYGALLKSLGVTWDSDCALWPRDPDVNARRVKDTSKDRSTVWHQEAHDGHYPYALVFWSNNRLPNIRSIETHERFIASAGDVVLVRNLLAEHHTPEEIVKDRWLCQAWISFRSQLAFEL